jgi:Tfp pilus assembly PilM family ATPase
MSISIYISTEQIEVLDYNGKNIIKYVAYPLSEGVMYNGTIIDYPLLLEALTALVKSNPGLFKGEVTLIVDGSTLLSRKITCPKLNNKQYLNLVRDEFVDSFESLDDIV